VRSVDTLTDVSEELTVSVVTVGMSLFLEWRFICTRVSVSP